MPTFNHSVYFSTHSYIIRVQGASHRGRPTPPATLAQKGKKYIKLCEANRGPRLNLVLIVIANRRLDNAKSPAAMLQEKTAPTSARTPHHTIRVADVVRTYIPQIGYYCCTYFPIQIFSFFVLVCTKNAEAQHGTRAKPMKMKPKSPKQKTSLSPLVQYFSA